MSRHEQHLVAVAANGLVGSCVPVPDRPLSDRDWERFLTAVATERLPGHLASAIASGAFPSTPEQFEQAVDLHTGALAHTLRLERLLLRVASCLHDARIDHRVIKGPAFAYTAYPNPSSRVYGDIDLLVPSYAIELAATVLRSEGFSRTTRLRWAGLGSRSSDGPALRCEDGMEVDLTHEHDLFGGPVDPGGLFEHAVEFTVGGRALRTLPPEELLLHVSYEAACGNALRLSTSRDVAELVLSTPMDVERVLAAASRCPWGPAAVADAVRTTWERFALADIVPLSVWASRYRPDDDERRALAELRTSRTRTPAQRATRAIRRLMRRVPLVHSWRVRVASSTVAPRTEGRRG